MKSKNSGPEVLQFPRSEKSTDLFRYSSTFPSPWLHSATKWTPGPAFEVSESVSLSRSVLYTCTMFLKNLENVIQIILSFFQKKLGCTVSSIDMNMHCDCRGTVVSILIKGHIQDFVKFAISLCEKVFSRFANHWLLRTNQYTWAVLNIDEIEKNSMVNYGVPRCT